MRCEEIKKIVLEVDNRLIGAIIIFYSSQKWIFVGAFYFCHAPERWLKTMEVTGFFIR